jgi:hypothetical protein
LVVAVAWLDDPPPAFSLAVTDLSIVVAPIAGS